MTSRSNPPMNPDDCMSMVELRVVIDALDADLVDLLRRRQDCIDRAARLKHDAGLPARIPARVDEVLAKVQALSGQAGLDPDLSAMLWRSMIEWAIAREDRALAPDTLSDADPKAE